MSDWPVGLSTGCFYRRSIFECLEPIVHGGFNLVEVCSSPQHLDYHDTKAVKAAAEQLRGYGIEAYSFHAPFADEIDITSLHQEARLHARNEIMTAAQAAATLGVRYFVIHPGPEHSYSPPGTERLQRMTNAAAILEEVCGYCERLGIRILLENMLPHLVFGNVPDMLWIMGAIVSLNVGTCLDTGHALLSGNIGHVIYKLSGHLKLIHASDNRGSFDDHLPPGQGSIDWGQLLLAVSQSQFRGGIIMELAGNKDESFEEMMHKARQGRVYLRNIARRLAMSSPVTDDVASSP